MQFVISCLHKKFKVKIIFQLQAKKFVESAPQVVKKDLTKDEAEKLKEALAGAGAEIAIEQ